MIGLLTHQIVMLFPIYWPAIFHTLKRDNTHELQVFIIPAQLDHNIGSPEVNIM